MNYFTKRSGLVIKIFYKIWSVFFVTSAEHQQSSHAALYSIV